MQTIKGYIQSFKDRQKLRKQLTGWDDETGNDSVKKALQRSIGNLTWTIEQMHYDIDYKNGLPKGKFIPTHKGDQS